MLNKDNQRELCYLVTIDEIRPIEGKDRVECAVVGGWTIMVRKGQFEPGDVGIYFEIDSKVPETEEAFAFLAPKKYKIKTQKYGKFYSQGLLMSAEDFGWKTQIEPIGGVRTEVIIDGNGDFHYPNDETRFLTKVLGVTYAVAEDNKRKATSVDKYKSMAQRHRKLFAKQPFRWLMKRDWGKKLLFIFFGKKKDKRGWPAHIASKTDVERIQNMTWILNDKEPYIATEKVDGSSFTAAAEKNKFGKIKYYVCSRNVVFENETQTTFYNNNIWYEAYNKYNLKEILTNILNDYNLDNVAIQAEIYGAGVQKRDYSITEHQMAVFHIVTNKEKFSIDKVVEICDKYGLPHVPIIDWNYILPDNLEDMQQYVEATPSAIDGKMKEGIVFYDKATGSKYFKFVSPEYLIKYH